MDLNKMQAPKINPFDFPTVKCSSCGNETFVPAMMFRRIPGVVVGRADQNTVDFPLKVFICSKCGALSPADKELIEAAENGQSDNESEVKTEKPKSKLIIE